MMKLRPGRWYGWQMLPGYVDSPYFSPIRTETVKLVSSAPPTIDLRFLNALYAQGVQIFEKRLEVICSAKTYLMAREVGSDLGRAVVIVEMSFGWLEACCPHVATELGSRLTNHELAPALDRLFGQRSISP